MAVATLAVFRGAAWALGLGALAGCNDGVQPWLRLQTLQAYPSVVALRDTNVTASTLPAHEWRLLAISLGGAVVCSTDGGSTWAPLASGPNQGRLRDLALTRTGALVAVGVHGSIWRSGDGGQTWQPVGVGVTAQHLVRVAVSTDGALLAIGHRGAVLRSGDGGWHWTPSAAIESQGAVESLREMDGTGPRLALAAVADALQADDVWQIKVGPEREVLALGVGGALALSHDGGQNWQQVPPGESERLLRARLVDPKGAIVLLNLQHSSPSQQPVTGLPCCTSQKRNEMTATSDAAMPWHPQAPISVPPVASNG